MKGESAFYHVCTDGLSRTLLFKDDRDYIAGMNDVAICSMAANVRIYCFCLMSNHVHFVMKGTEDACISFIRKYKRLRSFRNSERYGKAACTGYPTDISIKKTDTPEYQLSVMAYVMRNPLSAGMPVMPGLYPWSSAPLYFAYGRRLPPGYRSVTQFSNTELRDIVKTRISLPSDYLIDSNGMIWPGCYVEYRAVEKIFGSPKRLLFYLSKNQDLEHELESGVIAKASYSDSEIGASAEALAMARFKQKNLNGLSIEHRYLLAKELHHRYGASPKQIARVTGLDPELLKALL